MPGTDPVAGLLAGLPHRNTGRRGLPGDLLNLVFFGPRDAVRAGLRRAGWNEIPVAYPAAIAAWLGDLARLRPFERFPPMNHYALDGRRQDLNFARNVRPPHARHHFRLWRLPAAGPGGVDAWWGAANYDVAIRWSDLSHRTDPALDPERDFIARSLRDAGFTRQELRAVPGLPREVVNDKGYRYFTADGRALVVWF